jgi:low temperature requirement protein LtrA
MECHLLAYKNILISYFLCVLKSEQVIYYIMWMNYYLLMCQIQKKNSCKVEGSNQRENNKSKKYIYLHLLILDQLILKMVPVHIKLTQEKKATKVN